jgi:hypothetical protein
MIVIASFAVFAIDQTKTASGQQQQKVNSAAPATTAGQSAATPAPAKENGLHKAVDEASSKLTSPFAGIVSGSGSEWGIRGTKLLLALLVYGFGLGYLARMLGVRV